MFLALCGSAPLDWEWLIAIREVNAEKVLCHPCFSSDFSSLVEEGVTLGYASGFARTTLVWAVHRILLHTGTPDISQVGATQIVEFTEALERFGSRMDVACFFGSAEQYIRQLKHHYLPALHLVQ